MIARVGSVFTFTVAAAVFVHPVVVFVPTTVYEVVEVGVAVGVADVELLSPVAGDHKYVFAPDAVNTILVCPLQILILPPPAEFIAIVGSVFTLTVATAVLVQPVTVVVPVTV